MNEKENKKGIKKREDKKMNKDIKEVEYYVDITCYNYKSAGNDNMSDKSYTFNTYEKAKEKYISLLNDADLKKEVKNKGGFAYSVNISNGYEKISSYIII